MTHQIPFPWRAALAVPVLVLSVEASAQGHLQPSLSSAERGPAEQPGYGPGEERRPNIVLILADDMGYSDLGATGGEIETPHLDALTAGGLLFERFYNMGRCYPTRASLLTGLSPHQAGIGSEVKPLGAPFEPGPYQGFLND